MTPVLFGALLAAGAAALPWGPAGAFPDDEGAPGGAAAVSSDAQPGDAAAASGGGFEQAPAGATFDIAAPPPDSGLGTVEDRLSKLEAQIALLLKEIHSLRAHGGGDGDHSLSAITKRHADAKASTHDSAKLKAGAKAGAKKEALRQGRRRRRGRDR